MELIPISKYGWYKHTHLTHINLHCREMLIKIKIHCTECKNLMKMRKQKIKKHNFLCTGSEFYMQVVLNI